MSKHKKTRQEKIIAGLRRKLAYQKTNKQSKSLEKPQEKESLSENKPIATHFKYQAKLPETNFRTQKEISTNKYPYLKHDLLKTGLLTTSFLIVELLLFFALKSHIFKLPMLSY